MLEPFDTPTQTPVPQQQTPGPTNSKDPLLQFLEEMETQTSRRDPNYGSLARNPVSVPRTQTERFENQDFGYMYGADNEDFYGQRQDWLDKLGNGALKLVGYTVAKTGAGLGYLGGLANPQNWLSDEGVLSAAADNGFSKVFNNLEEKVRNDWAPTFQEAEDRDKGFWSRAFTDMDFWTEDFVDGLAFMASAYIPGGIATKMGVGVKLAKGLSTLKLGANAASKAVPGIESATTYLRQAANLSSKLDKGLTWGLATASEAMVEAKGVKDYLQDYLSNTDYSYEERDNIMKGAMKNTFIMNSVLLGATNWLEINMLYKALGKSSSTAQGILQEGKLGTAFTRPPIAAPIGRLDKILQSPVTKFIGSGTKGVLREGFVEENAQLAIQRLNQEYGQSGRIATILDTGDLISKYITQTGKAISGQDQEASMSIGLGGILGGIPTAIGDLRQSKRDNITTEEAVKNLNLAQSNWLKFGNIYKTETVETKDAGGNIVKTERLVLDANKKPVEDLDKIKAISAAAKLNMNLFTDADKETSMFKRKLMRDTAFSQFVGAHIAAGTEETLLSKLDDAVNATPEEIAQLGFDPTLDYKKQIQEYKNLAGSIIKKNKIIQSDVIFENTEIDRSRKNMLTEYAAQQAVYENLAADTLTQAKQIQDEFITPPLGVTTDSLVSQLNLLQMRIDSAKETLEDTNDPALVKMPFTQNLTMKLIDELTREKEKIEQDNEETVSNLKKINKRSDYYAYEERKKDALPMINAYEAKMKLHGELLNEVRLTGLKFGQFADTTYGSGNYERYRNYIEKEILQPAIDAIKKAETERTKKENQETAPQEKSSKLGKKINVKYKKPGDENKVEEVVLQEGQQYKKIDPKTNTEAVLVITKISADGKLVDLIYKSSPNAPFEKIRSGTPEQVVSVLIANNWVLDTTIPTVPPGSKSSTAKSVEEKDMDPDDNTKDSDDFVEDLLPDDVGLSHSGIKPKWEEVKFFKTFGRHYLTDDDINTEDGSDRFYMFTSKHSLANRNYALKVITKHNDKDFKIRNTKINPDDIKVIVVKINSRDGDIVDYSYVDINDKVIPEGKENKNNIIYTSLADINNWTVKRVRESYTVDAATTDEEIQEEIDKHKALQASWLQQLKENPDKFLELPIDRVSPGVRTAEKTASGQYAANPVEGRIIQKDPDWNDLRSVSNPNMKIALRISTLDKPIKGVKPGRALMQEYETFEDNNGNVRKIWSDKMVQVFTRKMDDAEQDKLYSAVVRIVELMNKKNPPNRNKKNYRNFWSNKNNKYKNKKQKADDKTKKSAGYLTEKEKEEFTLLYTWLKGVTLWGEPKSGKSRNRYMFIKNGLRIGSELISPPITKEKIKEKKRLLLKEPYYNINRTYLLKNESFTDIEFKGGKAIPGKEFATYEQFLLDGNTKDRSAPPVYTSFPLYDSNIPQRKSAYIIWKPDEEEDNQSKKSKTLLRDLKMSNRDKMIDEFFIFKRNKIQIGEGDDTLYIERENALDGSFIIHMKQKDQKLKSVKFDSREQFDSAKREFLNKVKELTGYKYGSDRIKLRHAAFYMQQGDSDTWEVAMPYVGSGTASKKASGVQSLASVMSGTTKDETEDQTEDETEDDNVEEEVITIPEEGDIIKTSEDNEYEVTSVTETTVVIKDIATGKKIKYPMDAFLEKMNDEIFTYVTPLSSSEDEVDAEEEAPFDVEENKPIAKTKTSTRPSGKSTTKKTTPNLTIEDAVKNAYIENGNIIAELYQMNVNTKEANLQARASIPGTQITPLVRKRLIDILIGQIPADFRLATPDIAIEKYEDFEELNAFMKRVLPQFMVYKTTELIKGKAYGAFMNSAIYIYENAEYGTGFHEAFEAVWNSYLSDQEKEDLASEYRSREGTFFNKYSNLTKPYSSASMWDIKEMLAEEFRGFIINNGAINAPRESTVKTKNIFQKLWDYIKTLLNLKPLEKEELDNRINKLFKRIKEGDYARINTIPEVVLAEPEYAKVPGFSQKEITDILEGLSSFFFQGLYISRQNIDALLGSASPKEQKELFTKLYEQAFSQVSSILSRYKSDKHALFLKHGVGKGMIYERFKKKLEKYGVQFNEIVDQGDEDTRAEKNPLGIVDSISVNPMKMTSTNVMMLLASLPQVYFDQNIPNPSYVLERNDMYLPKLVESDKVHTLLLNELSNLITTYDAEGNIVSTLDKMVAKLDKKYKNSNGIYKQGYGWIRNLKMRLRYEDANGNRIDTADLSKDDVTLRIGFVKSFTNVKYIPSKLIIGENGRLYNVSPLVNVNEDRIQKQWANNLKIDIQTKKNDMFKLDKEGKMTINRSSDRLLKLLADKDAEETTLLSALDMLDALGIRFSATLEELSEPIPGMSISPARTIIENARQIYNVISKGIKSDSNFDINTIFARDKQGLVTGRINDLSGIEAQYSSEENILSFLNGEGESQYAVGISSLYGNMINIINSVGSLSELVQTCPWLGRINEDGEVELHAYQAGSDLLKPGGTIFDKNGNKKSQSNLRYQILVGTGISDLDGVNSAKLEYPERIAQKISYLLNKQGSVGFSIINSEKSNEFGLGLPTNNTVLLSINDLKKYISSKNEVGDTAVISKYIGHLFDEMNAAKAYFEEADSPNIDQYKDRVANLGHFTDILGPTLIDKFKKDVLSIEDPEKEFGDIAIFIADNKAAIVKKIDAHIKDQIRKTKDLLLKNDIFEFYEVEDADFNYVTQAVDNERLNELLSITEGKQEITFKKTVGRQAEEYTMSAYTEPQLDLISAYLAINEEVIATEQHKLVFGHPALYKDLAKRASGATSTKEPIVDDPQVIEWMDIDMPRNDGKIRSEQIHQTFRNVSFADVSTVSLFFKETAEAQYLEYRKAGMSKEKAEAAMGARFDEANGELKGYILDKKGKYTGNIKAYLDLTEADAMAYALPDMVRDLMFLSSKFDDKLQKQWNYEMAYERLVRGGIIKNQKGEIIKSNDLRYRPHLDKDQMNADLAIYKKGNPDYIFPVLKTQYFGYANTSGMTHTTFLKHSIQPKFFRHVEGTQFEKIYIAAQNNQVDIIGFESGQKVGNINSEDGTYVPIYNEKGSVNVDEVELITESVDYQGSTRQSSINTYYLTEDLPIQDLHLRFFGIQVEQAPKAKTYTVRGSQVTKVVLTNLFENGKVIVGKDGKPDKEIQKTIREYNETLVKMIKLGKEKLINELGLEKTKTGYKVKDLRKLVGILRREAESRDMPENIIDAINVLDTGDLMYNFDTLINRNKIDNILNALVDSRVISEKLHGKSSVQVASTLYEFENRKYIYLNDDGTYQSVNDVDSMDPKDRKKVRMASSDLKFYRNEKGVIKGMEVYIGWPFKDVTPEQLGLQLDNGIYKVPEAGMKTLHPKLLQAMGFRIPTQSPNSIEFMQIKGFTPAVNGDMIVVPSEIVGKAGSDFDIDKLYMYLPNYELFIGDRAFGTDEFRNYISKYLTEERNIPKSQVNRLMSILTKDRFEEINKAAFNEDAREMYDVAYSLEGMPSDFNSLSVNDLTMIKKGIMAYKRDYKGYKELKYIEPDDTTSKGLQNKFIELNRRLILHPSNFAQLVAPNSVANLKELADLIRERKEMADPTKVKPNEKSAAFLRSFVGSLSTRERYILTKRMVGISALHTTFHALAQVSGLRINSDKDYTPYYLVPSKDKEKESPNEGIVIRFDHHEKNEDGTYSIGHRYDTDGVRISDSFSEATSGFVDGAKDPFVFDLNFSLNNSGVYFYLYHFGVPKDQIMYFMNQPIMDSYFSEMAKNKSTFKKINQNFLTREEMFFKVISPYLEKTRGRNIWKELSEITPKNQRAYKDKIIKSLDAIYKAKDYQKFTVDQLKEGMFSGSLNEDNKNLNANLQIAVLMNYLRYEAQSQKLSDFIQSITYDTQATKTIQENRYQEAKWKRMSATGFIANPSSLLTNTFIGEMKEQKEDITNLFEKFFITLDPKIQKVFEPIYELLDNPDYFLTKDEATVLLNRYQNHVLNYILHTTKFVDKDKKSKALNDLYQQMFLGSESVALRLNKLKSDNIDDSNISDNLFLRELLPVISNDPADPNNIRLFRSRLDTYDINNVIESLDNLREYAEQSRDMELIKFIDDVVKFAIIQSGVGTSMIDYKSVLSVDTYSNLVKTILDTFKSRKTELNTEQVWRTFHQNNANIRSIVPKAPSYAVYENGVMKLNAESSGARVQFYIKYLPTVSKKKMAEMIKAKVNTRDYYKPVLFERSAQLDQGDIIYYPLEIMGDGRNAIEIYTNPEQSSIFKKNNFEKMIDVSIANRDEGYIRPMTAKELLLKAEGGVEKSFYEGGKGGFSDVGKGTPAGDGKDKQMRKEADSIISEIVDKTSVIYGEGETKWEIDEGELGVTPTETSLLTVASKNDGYITRQGKTYISLAEDPKVVMLARDRKLKGQELSQRTKNEILTLHQNGAKFIVGDMPGVDDKFVTYLQNIGAKYNIYYTGKNNRIQSIVDKNNIPVLNLNLSLEDLMEPDNSQREQQSSSYSYKEYVDLFNQSGLSKKNKPMPQEKFQNMNKRAKAALIQQLKNCP